MKRGAVVSIVRAWAGNESRYASGPCPRLGARIAGWLDSLAEAPPEKARELVAKLVRAGPSAWPVLEGGLDHASYEVRLGAIEAIGAGPHPRAVALLDAFASDRDRILNGRLLALRWIGRTGKSAAIGVLARFALGEEVGLRGPAIVALGGFRSPEAVDLLLSIAERTGGSEREKTVEALRQITGTTRPGRSIEEWKRWWRLHRYRIVWEIEEGGPR
jgi:HEAT repeat protein